MIKRLLSIFLIATLMSFCTGCAQKVEIVNLAKVMALGVDTTPDGKYVVSIRIISETSSQKASGMPAKKGGGGPAESTVYAASGDTIAQALNKLNKQLGKEIRLSHNKVIIIGEETARKGIHSILDYSLRIYQMRPNIPVLVAKGTALEIMKIETPDNPLPPVSIEQILDTQDKIGYAPFSTNLDIADALLNKITSPIAAVIKQNTDEITNINSFKVEGTAVFKKDKLIGFMNDKETRGLEWVIGRIRNSAVVLPGVKNRSLTTIVLDSSAKMTPILEKDNILIQIDIKNKANIREMTDDLDIMKNPKIMDELNEIQNKTIKYEIEEAINAAQKNFKEDIFGFGEAIHRKYPKEWKKLKDKWTEEFGQCRVKVNVHSSIKRPGNHNRTIKQ